MIMEKKPIRRNENILRLSREHHFSLLFCWKIRQGLKKGIDPERMINYAAYFRKHHAEPHFREEEEIIFDPFPDGMTRKAVDEHEALRRLFEEIALRSGRADEQIAGLLSSLADELDQHVRFEERELFPYLEEKLNDEELSQIGRALDALPAEAKDNYEDEFWLNKASL